MSPLGEAPDALIDADLTVRRVDDAAGRRAFLDLPYTLYGRDPNFRPPLRFERASHLKRHLSGKEPTEQHALFLCERRGEVVGRIAAFLNRAHLDRYEDGAGHFGLLAAVDDQRVVAALLRAAEEHLRGLGMTQIVGPYDFSVNEEIGLPESGFDTPPMLMMPYARPALAEAVAATGYETKMRLLAFVVDLDAHYPRPPVVQKLQAQVEADPSLRLRKMEPKRFREDVRACMAIFNDAWANNWSYLPFSDEQVDHVASELKPLLEPDAFWIGEKNGEPMAFVVMAPNVNEAARDLSGRMLPFGWAKLLWRLKRHEVTTARMMLMGVKQDLQKSRTGVALVCSLFEEAFAAGRAKGIKTCEMSWVLDNNVDVQRLIKLSGAEVYKTYRMVGKAL
ncbi:hypothetical protein [Parvularcula dongshanensis]|uniref:N-acetyltransferase domain-containing protein n=1 Tax=Parvularcula dongshanensis TaxID=1173995 RepID=A0A840I4L1_9PROT|nr:hypothetical protein [Parvularcula dongshanensis]MBB4659292.1 hypothetical protein [Parvularcula dongshanensis]